MPVLKLPEGPIDTPEKARQLASYVHAFTYRDIPKDQMLASMLLLAGMLCGAIHEMAQRIEALEKR